MLVGALFTDDVSTNEIFFYLNRKKEVARSSNKKYNKIDRYTLEPKSSNENNTENRKLFIYGIHINLKTKI